MKTEITRTTPMSIAEQEAIVLWAGWNKNRSTRALITSGYKDEIDLMDFNAIIATPVSKLHHALDRYWNLDTVAKENFISIIQTAMK